MTTPRTAAITNLGCKVNQAEMDGVERALRAGGVVLVDDHDVADLYVVNTCTVTSTADQKSRQAVRRARRTNPEAQVIVTGCSVEVDRSAFEAADPAATLVDNASKEAFLADLAATLGLPGGSMPTLSGVVRAADGRREPVTAPIDGIADDREAIDRTRAFVKVQDGCSFHCTYCIIPRARGPERSRPPEDVLADVRSAVMNGHREVVLTGINVGTYDGGASGPGPRGSHSWEALSLAGLVRRILLETDVERLRLSSIEPQHVTDDLLAAWTDRTAKDRCLPHFHLPLQSGDDGILRRMGRRYVAADYEARVALVRQAIPGVAIHADVIAGFPGEDQAAFDATVAFLRSIEPAGLHVFRYSGRPGTPAVRMAGQVDEQERRRRSSLLLEFAAERREAFARSLVGRRLDVLFESPLPDGRWVGHAAEYVEVLAPPQPGTGSLENVRAEVECSATDPEAAERLAGTIAAIRTARAARVAPRARRPLPVLPGVPSAPPMSSSEGAHHAA